MSFRIELYAQKHLPAVLRLNQRLREGKVQDGFLLPERPNPAGATELEETPSAPLVKRQFVVLEDEDVHGGFQLQDQEFVVGNARHWVGNIQMPISEGLVDRRYSYVAALLMRSLLETRPLLFAVGMGSLEAPFAKVLKALRWRVVLVPFRFRVLRVGRFLRHIGPLREDRKKALAADLAAWTGLGQLSFHAAQWARSISANRGGNLRREPIENWDDWADSVWAAHRDGCSFGAVRDFQNLEFSLRLCSGGLMGFRFQDDTGPAGWAAVQVKQMRANAYFGDLRVATILDAAAAPGRERALIAGILPALREQADLVLCNHAHGRWLAALDACGFWTGPSNFVLATSPDLTDAITAIDPSFERIHITRADGDGRLNL